MASYLTKSNVTPLYNINGNVHGASPLRASQVDVVDRTTNIRNRGAAHRLIDPDSAFILVSSLVTTPTPTPTPVPIPPSPATGLRVRHDRERPLGIWRVRLPEIFREKPDHAVIFTKAMQELWFQVNFLLTSLDPLLWRKLGGNELYLFNGGHGFPGHHDYVNGMDINRPDPRAPIMLICGGAPVKGRVGTSLRESIQQVIAKRSLLALVNTQVLWLNYIDTNKPMPTAEEVIADGLYWENVTVQKDGSNGKFPQGKGKRTYTPLFASRGVYLPMEDLIPV